MPDGDDFAVRIKADVYSWGKLNVNDLSLRSMTARKARPAIKVPSRGTPPVVNLIHSLRPFNTDHEKTSLGWWSTSPAVDSASKPKEEGRDLCKRPSLIPALNHDMWKITY